MIRFPAGILLLSRVSRQYQRPPILSSGIDCGREKLSPPPKSSTELRMYELKPTLAFTSLHYVLLNYAQGTTLLLSRILFIVLKETSG